MSTPTDAGEELQAHNNAAAAKRSLRSAPWAVLLLVVMLRRCCKSGGSKLVHIAHHAAAVTLQQGCAAAAAALQQHPGGHVRAAVHVALTLRGRCLCSACCAAVVQVHLETVELSIEGSGAPLSMKIPLINGKLHVCAIEKALAAKKLSLVTINGVIPVPDGGGFSQQRYSPADSLTIQAAPKPGVCRWDVCSQGA